MEGHNYRVGRLNLITHGVESCSGFCRYCTARITDLVSQGFNIHDIEKSLKSINEKTYKEAKWDFEALENRLITHPYWNNLRDFTLWGGDPLGSFYCLQENVDFIRYLEGKYNRKFNIGFCTNGLGSLIEDWVKYLIDNNIHFTLSHDGLGQEIRTLNFDPLKFDGMKELLKNKSVGSISPVLNQYNSDPIENYKYLSQYGIPLRLSKAKNGDYDVKATNQSGLCNGKFYEELKGKPYGDFLIHNDYENPILRNQLDIYIDGWKYIIDHYNDFPLIKSSFTKQCRLNRVDFDDGNASKNPCFQFQHGMRDYSSTIDTLGKDCECMLMDSRTKSSYHERDKKCENCKYKYRYECWECDVMSHTKDSTYDIHNCEFNYRYQELMDYANAKFDFYDANYKLYQINQVLQGGKSIAKNKNRFVSKGCSCKQEKNRQNP